MFNLFGKKEKKQNEVEDEKNFHLKNFMILNKTLKK